MNEQGQNCAFQYAKMSDRLLRKTEIVCDETGLTEKEAKELWNKYFKDAARHIKEGGTVEMVIGVDMSDKHSYGETLAYITPGCESDGISIWETKKEYFPVEFRTE